MSTAARGASVFVMFWLLVLTGVVEQNALRADDLVIVRLIDGGRRVGEIDSRTNQQQLWLHTSDHSVVVQSSVPWNRVESAEVRGETLSVDELRLLAERQQSPPPGVKPSPRTDLSEQRRFALRPAVDSISVTAELANWTRDPLPDGLKLRVLPVDGDDQLLPVNGLATIRLFGRRVPSDERLETSAPFAFWTNGGTVREYDPAQRIARYIEVGCWTRRIRVGHFDDVGVTLRLPYQAVDPERDLDLALDGLVDVSLRVDGQGIHRASIPVELRTFSPFREELQLHRRQRFLPGE